MVRISRVFPAVALALGVAATAAAQDGPDRDTVVAAVGDTEITLGHVLLARDGLPDQFRQMPADQLFEPLVEQLVDQTALMQSAEGTLTQRDQRALDNGRRDYIANAALTRAAEAALTDAAIAEAYDAFAAEYDADGPTREYNAAHIIVETEEEAADLRAQLDDGADFAELARANSTDGAAANGGSLGWFGPGDMIPAFEDAVAGMEVGEVAGPIQTRFGWHVVQLNDTRMATVPPLEEVREQLVQSIRREAVEAEIARAKESTDISRDYSDIDPGVLTGAAPLDD